MTRIDKIYGENIMLLTYYKYIFHQQSRLVFTFEPHLLKPSHLCAAFEPTANLPAAAPPQHTWFPPPPPRHPRAAQRSASPHARFEGTHLADDSSHYYTQARGFWGGGNKQQTSPVQCVVFSSKYFWVNTNLC